ncbi:Lipopolysaccharide export system permease protein LptF [Candidatus Gullanella endobia]|uniref:Lipopolysaccharide export system permease protein LptF n=1 Tax=Candidatus Gullanella endobia TaxID=1070130 RepID=A0A143WR25_9ENTR|nr:LPS export ABC transporter permease LptF [Candidatus Gullanella endobia]CUX96246.1 Lipopolysaccharide export system permease protein LptF [Candidatus Gullanella endobia]
MIITRYLVREAFKSQFTILFILLLIFLCQKLVRILGVTVNGNIPLNLVLSLLALNMPEMMKLILPLSLFLGLLITLSRMYTESEITVMYACGFGKNILIRSAIFLSLITVILAIINVVWISPWSSQYQDMIISKAKANLSIGSLIEGQFKQIENDNLVLFVSKIKDKCFKHIFLVQLKPNDNMRIFVIVAKRGYIKQRLDGSQLVMLEKGTLYEGTALLRDFRITDFSKYQAIIGRRVVTVNRTDAHQFLHKLWYSNEPKARAELHWRFTLVISVVIMAVMVVPLSVINPRQGRILSILPAMLLYLIFFLLQTVLHSNDMKDKINSILWMWLINATYLILALVLNLWDSVPMKRLFRYIYKRRIA